MKFELKFLLIASFVKSDQIKRELAILDNKIVSIDVVSLESKKFLNKDELFTPKKETNVGKLKLLNKDSELFILEQEYLLMQKLTDFYRRKIMEEEQLNKFLLKSLEFKSVPWIQTLQDFYFSETSINQSQIGSSVVFNEDSEPQMCGSGGCNNGSVCKISSSLDRKDECKPQMVDFEIQKSQKCNDIVNVKNNAVSRNSRSTKRERNKKFKISRRPSNVRKRNFDQEPTKPTKINIDNKPSSEEDQGEVINYDIINDLE